MPAPRKREQGGSNRGARKLWAYIHKNHGSPSDRSALEVFAWAIEASVSGVRKWLYGDRKPNVRYLPKVRKLTGIDYDDWHTQVK